MKNRCAPTAAPRPMRSFVRNFEPDGNFESSRQECTPFQISLHKETYSMAVPGQVIFRVRLVGLLTAAAALAAVCSCMSTASSAAPSNKESSFVALTGHD